MKVESVQKLQTVNFASLDEYCKNSASEAQGHARPVPGVGRVGWNEVAHIKVNDVVCRIGLKSAETF